MKSSEILERKARYPLSKNEMVNYLVRLQNSTDKLDLKTYKKLISCPRFKEILNEVQL